MKAKELMHNLGVRKVIFNGKTTIVYLTTGEKGVANCGEHDEFDPVVGIAMAYLAAESQGSKRELKQATDYMYRKGTFEMDEDFRGLDYALSKIIAFKPF
jgi:hypothetical protein